MTLTRIRFVLLSLLLPVLPPAVEWIVRRPLYDGWSFAISIGSAAIIYLWTIAAVDYLRKQRIEAAAERATEEDKRRAFADLIECARAAQAIHGELDESGNEDAVLAAARNVGMMAGAK